MSFNNSNNRGSNVHLHSATTTAATANNTNLFVGHAMTPSPYYFPQPQFSVSGCYYYNYPPPHSPNSPGNGFFAPLPHHMMRGGGGGVGGGHHHPNGPPHPFMMPMHPRHHLGHPMGHLNMQQQQQKQMYHHQHLLLQSNQNFNLDTPQKRNHHRRRHNKTKCKFISYFLFILQSCVFLK